MVGMHVFETARLISGRTTPVLTLVNAYVAVVQPKLAGQLVKCLQSDLPLGPLQHLKRVKPADNSAGEPLVEVLLCVQPENSNSSGISAAGADAPSSHEEQQQQKAWPVNIPSKTAAALAACKAELKVRQVPLTPPYNEEQFLQWRKIWPMPWRIPAGAVEQDGEPPTLQDQQYFEQHMTAALAASAAAGSRNVALIVDPASGQVLAQAVDSSDEHPLDHAAMKAIELVAARDRQLWPFNGFAHVGRHADAPDDTGYEAVQTLPHQHHARSDSMNQETDTSRPGKKQKAATDSIHPGSAASAADESGVAAVPSHGDGRQSKAGASLVTADGQHSPAATQPAVSRAAAPSAIDSDSVDWSKKPYLCTGFDCFVVNEPCYMCGMGLVHSRLSRVVFCNLDKNYGVLGGRYRLHAERTLNHHYKVYHMPLKQQQATAEQQQLSAS